MVSFRLCFAVVLGRSAPLACRISRGVCLMLLSPSRVCSLPFGPSHPRFGLTLREAQDRVRLRRIDAPRGAYSFSVLTKSERRSGLRDEGLRYLSPNGTGSSACRATLFPDCVPATKSRCSVARRIHRQLPTRHAPSTIAKQSREETIGARLNSHPEGANGEGVGGQSASRRLASVDPLPIRAPSSETCVESPDSKVQTRKSPRPHFRATKHAQYKSPIASRTSRIVSRAAVRARSVPTSTIQCTCFGLVR